MVGRVVAGEDEQLLDVAPHGPVEQLLDLLGLMQVRAVRLERAVLAVRHAGPREGERDVAREGDAAPHPAESTERGSSHSSPCSTADPCSSWHLWRPSRWPAAAA